MGRCCFDCRQCVLLYSDSWYILSDLYKIVGQYRYQESLHMNNETPKIIYTLTDEAPLLATCSLLPIIRTFASGAGIEITKNEFQYYRLDKVDGIIQPFIYDSETLEAALDINIEVR